MQGCRILFAGKKRIREGEAVTKAIPSRSGETSLKEMASPDYQFPEKADKKDVTGILASIAVCLILIVLCMTEVIK